MSRVLDLTDDARRFLRYLNPKFYKQVAQEILSFLDDPVDALKAQVGSQDRDPLPAAVLVEQRGGDGDRPSIGQARGVNVLDRRMGGTIGEERLAGLRHSLVLGQG